MEIIKVENITKQFSDKFVLRNFSFVVNEKDKINISGPSGIGKTTLFRLLLGFETPDEGKIYFENAELSEEKIWEVRKKVAYVSQDLSIGHGKVSTFFNETLNYKANIHQKGKTDIEKERLFKLFELPDSILNKNIEELSGGEKQRVAIINALLLGRTIFFLDEVSSALDIKLKKTVLDFFLCHPDFTVLYISHDNYLPENSNVRILKLANDE